MGVQAAGLEGAVGVGWHPATGARSFTPEGDLMYAFLFSSGEFAKTGS
eukprot:COSAG06_NODE_52705_length_304_cov_0.756098_2_plen_47_part_01